jgi:hypothetical protein
MATTPRFDTRFPLDSGYQRSRVGVSIPPPLSFSCSGIASPRAAPLQSFGMRRTVSKKTQLVWTQR